MMFLGCVYEGHRSMPFTMPQISSSLQKVKVKDHGHKGQNDGQSGSEEVTFCFEKLSIKF